MKSLLRGILFNAFSLFVLTQFLSGVKVQGGFSTYLLAGIILTLLYKFLKPVLSLVSLPLNLLTLGAVSFIINIFLFYLATSFIPEISIVSFTFQGANLSGFVIPRIYLNTFLAYAAAAFFQSLIVSFLTWLRK